MNWQDNPRSKAAALAGVATNQAYPLTDRLTAAIEALDLLFEHMGQQDAEAAEANGRGEEDLCRTCTDVFTGAERMRRVHCLGCGKVLRTVFDPPLEMEVLEPEPIEGIDDARREKP